MMRFHWRDFLDDEDFIKKIEAYEENGHLVARIFSRTYTKDHVTVKVHLFEVDHYEEEIEWEEQERRIRTKRRS